MLLPPVVSTIGPNNGTGMTTMLQRVHSDLTSRNPSGWASLVTLLVKRTIRSHSMAPTFVAQDPWLLVPHSSQLCYDAKH